MVEAVPFLTKILVPGRLPTSVRRTRLLDLLHRRVSSRLTLLSAGPGYGKTTLLADFAAEIEAPVCWYSLDEHDAEPRTFASYLLASVRQRFPAFGRRTEVLLREPAPSPDWVRTLAGMLVTELVADVPEYLLLVLDDVHVLAHDSAVWQLMDYVLTRPPENCHFMLAGRELPLLESLPRLLARAHATVLRIEDLRFTDDELQELLRQRWGERIPESVLRRAQEYEGWAAGLVLSGLTQGVETPAIRDDREWVFRYLATEVLDAQHAQARSFLLASSILPEVRPEICDVVLNRRDSAEMLARLAEGNLFLQPLLAQGQRWYRYHALFREFLSARLRNEDPAGFIALHRQAGKLAEKRGDWGSALHHYQTIGDAELLTRGLERGGEELFRRGRWSELRRAFAELSPEVTESSSALLLLRAQMRLDSGRPVEAERDARLAERIAERSGDGPLHQKALTFQTSALRVQGRCPEALGLAEQAISLAESHAATAELAEAWRQAGMCHVVLGNFERAIETLLHSLALFMQLEDDYNLARVADELGMAFMSAGDLQRAEHHLVQAGELWRKLDNQVALAHTLNNLGVAAHYRGDIAQAEERLLAARDTARAAGYVRMLAYAHASLGDLARDCGNLEGAENAYHSASALSEESRENFLTAYLLNARGELKRRQGDLAGAEELSSMALGLAAARGSRYEQALYQTSLAITECEQGEVGRAIDRLGEAAENLRGCGARRELARARFQRARALFQARSNAEALDELEQVADLVTHLGYDAFLVSDMRSAPLLLQYAASKEVGGTVVRRWAANLAAPAPEAAKPVSTPARWSHSRVEAFALGETLVRVGERVVSNLDWRSAGSRELFFFLLSDGRWVRKEDLVDALWPDLDPARCESTFHSNAYRLRRALFPECLQHENGRYRLNPDVELWFDVREFERLVAEGDRVPSGAERASRYRDAVGLYQGPFLKDFYSDWCEGPRSKLESAFIRALGGLAEYLMERAEYVRAAELWERALATDSFQERAMQQLMLCYAEAGDRGSAMRHYRLWEETMRNELGAEPSPETQRLYRALQSGREVRRAAANS